MTNITLENKSIARIVANAFGGKPEVHQYLDEAGHSSVGLLVSIDRPQRGISSYSTIGLSDFPNLIGGDDKGVRIELVGACASSVRKFPNILTTAAFCVINSKWTCYPGAIFPDVVSAFNCSKTMKHLMFVPPFLWEENLHTLEFQNKTVAWLLAVPISEEEFRFAESEGADNLEALFEKNQIDIFDINRPTIV